MPNTREKLIKIIEDSGMLDNKNRCGIVADELIANGVTIQKWIPVTERLPEYHKEVLTRSKMGTSGHHYSVAELWMIDDELGWVFDDGFEPQDIAEITHWMPLPEPPKEVSHTF